MNGSHISALPCMCSNFRRATRALTQFYEDALRPVGLRSSQFTILLVLSRVRETNQGELGSLLVMDSTTLTRTLRIMVRQGWIAERPGEDRRQRWLTLTKSGEARLRHATPLWENVQDELRRKLGDRSWKELLSFTTDLTNLVVEGVSR